MMPVDGNSCLCQIPCRICPTQCSLCAVGARVQVLVHVCAVQPAQRTCRDVRRAGPRLCPFSSAGATAGWTLEMKRKLGVLPRVHNSPQGRSCSYNKVWITIQIYLEAAESRCNYRC